MSHQVIVRQVMPAPQTSVNLKVEDVLTNNDPELHKVQVLSTQATKERSLLHHLCKFSDWTRMVKAIARLKRRKKPKVLNLDHLK